MIKGVVQKIIKNPQYGLTSFTLKGQDGFYSLGKDVPTFKEGDSIQFDTNPVGKYTYAKNIAPWTDGGTATGAPVANVAAAASSSGNGPGNSWKGRGGSQRGGFGGAGKKDEYWDAREQRDIEWQNHQRNVVQPRIEIQAARNAAIETAKAMWQFDITPKPKKASEHYDAFLALVEELTDKYLESTKVREHIKLSAESSSAGTVAGGNAIGSQEAISPASASVNPNDGAWE